MGLLDCSISVKVSSLNSHPIHLIISFILTFLVCFSFLSPSVTLLAQFSLYFLHTAIIFTNIYLFPSHISPMTQSMPFWADYQLQGPVLLSLFCPLPTKSQDPFSALWFLVLASLPVNLSLCVVFFQSISLSGSTHCTLWIRIEGWDLVLNPAFEISPRLSTQYRA